MSLIGALNIGKSALAVHQAALQVTSNNVANAGNPDYTREVANISPAGDVQLAPGMLMGTGVNLDSIQRQIDQALEGRLRDSTSDSAASQTQAQWLGRVEAIFHELGDDDLSTQLSNFFNSWSNLANNPQDMGLRQVVLQNGDSLASSFKTVRGQLGGLQGDIDKGLASLSNDANALADQVASLNGQIVATQGSGGVANAMLDQRDGVLKKLSQLVDIKVQDTGHGMVNVMVGSEPLVLGDTNRGIVFKQESGSNGVTASIAKKSDNGTLAVASGQLGAMLGLRGQVDGVIGQVDKLASNLIFELNQLHSSGQGLSGFSQMTSANPVADPAAALNTPAAGLPFTPTNGSFVVHVRQKGTGLVTSTLVQVDLDGLSGNDSSLNSLSASLNGISGVSASISGGRLKIQAPSSDVEISFSQDSSGVLAALGINSFFKGKNAQDIAVNSDLQSNPNLLAAAQNGEQGDNQTARAIAALASQPMAGLAGASLDDKYQSMITGIATSVSSAKTNADAASTILDTLTTQREALSGVSLDEEAINLMRERGFQGAARVVATVDQLMQTLLQLT